ncbi:hypothetical protein MSMTP_3034 [Methanosarcina sp. MTP4]|uniref:vWA domain-containing protein n=1 Tax=Methanosarcina sp. MTP4 TaxID=1434100 RepID=UPI000615CDBB|nr:VWA domain-containing protein [Methanosarcina sp. MTP4]AKB26503.1 hypothetical protein MSMTP_3034 [Methanosarcina sp. MTP4]
MPVRKVREEVKAMQETGNRGRIYSKLSSSESFFKSESSFKFERDFNPAKVLNTELRGFLSTPRQVPRPLREDIAEVLVYEIFSGKEYEIKDEKRFMEKFGVFYPLLLSMRNFQAWEDLKALAGSNHMAGLLVLKTLLEGIFTLIGDYEEIEEEITKSLQKNLEKALKVLKALIEETCSTWDERNIRQNPKYRESPGSENLESMTRKFMENEKTGQALDIVVEERIAVPLEEFISTLEDHLEILEMLSMLFPGRMWSDSLQALHREYFGNLEKYASLLRKSSDLRKILEQVGRIELEYGSKKLILSPHSKSEVHAVTFSNEIQTMLPVEAVKLKNPLLKRKFYADMFEGKLLTYQLRGKNWNSDAAGKKRRGPVVALVDTSASMRGSPEILAKTVVLAVTRRMLKEGRDVKVILFASKWQSFEIEMTNKKRMGAEFLDFLRHTFGGGTDFNTALRSGLKVMKEENTFRGADLLFLTDGYSELSEQPLIREWNEIKKERNARIFSLIIGNNNEGGLEQVSDHTYIIRNTENWGVWESPARFVKAIGAPVYR